MRILSACVERNEKLNAVLYASSVHSSPLTEKHPTVSVQDKKMGGQLQKQLS